MLKRVLPVAGMLLSCAALLVAFFCAGLEGADTEAAKAHLTHSDERVTSLQAHLGGEQAFLQQSTEHCQRIEAAAEALVTAVQPPDRKALEGMAGKVLDANWPLFMHRYYLATGNIGVLADADGAAVKAAERLVRDDLKRLGLGAKEEEKAGRVIAETFVLFGKARRTLHKWPQAVELERGRLIDEAMHNLKRVVPAQYLERAKRTLEERLR